MYDWRVIARPYFDDQLPTGQGVPQPFTVDVAVFWEEGGRARSVSLTSVVLGPMPP